MITEHTLLEIAREARMAIEDELSTQDLYRLDPETYVADQAGTQIPGTSVKISGSPESVESVFSQTVTPETPEYVVAEYGNSEITGNPGNPGNNILLCASKTLILK